MGDLLMIVSDEDYDSIAINIDAITYIEETETGCMIYLNTGTCIIVNHSFSDVINIFNSPYPYDSNKSVFIKRNTLK
jgi:hypothetical protein